MTVETATYISQLNPAYPAAGDPKSEGDDHIRLGKTVLQAQFPNLGAAAVTPTAAQLNDVVNKVAKSGDTYTGTHDLSGATSVLVPTPTTSGQAANKAYADALSMTAGNMPTGGTVGQYLRKSSSTDYDAAFATLTIPTAGLTLLATLTPTAAANVDFLSTFSSTYDNYLIVINGIKPSADDSLYLRLANAGASDSGSNYFQTSYAGNASTTALAQVAISSAATSAGKGVSGIIEILNANDATNIKSIFVRSTCQTAATPGYTSVGYLATYQAANAVSGLRLYWNAASNFQAVGNVRVYGYSKT